MRRESSREENECDDHESDERADEKAQQNRESILASSEILHEADEPGRQRRNLYARHAAETNALPISHACQLV